MIQFHHLMSFEQAGPRFPARAVSSVIGQLQGDNHVTYGNAMFTTSRAHGAYNCNLYYYYLEKRSCQLFYYCVHMARKTTPLCYVSFYVRCSVFHLGYVSLYVRCSVLDLPTGGSRVRCTCMADIVLHACMQCSPCSNVRMCMREELPSLELLLV